MDAFDADVLIYAAVPGHPLGEQVAALFRSVAPATVAGIGSVLLLPEVLAKPLRDDATDEVRILAALLARLDLRPVDRATAELATALSSRYRLKAADATHLATAVGMGADRFITNNKRDFPPTITEIQLTHPADLACPADSDLVGTRTSPATPACARRRRDHHVRSGTARGRLASQASRAHTPRRGCSRDVALPELWNGKIWQDPVPVKGDPLLSTKISVLAGASCPSTTECELVGVTGNSGTLPLAALWNGFLGKASISSQSVQVPPGSTFANLTGALGHLLGHGRRKGPLLSEGKDAGLRGPEVVRRPGCDAVRTSGQAQREHPEAQRFGQTQ